MMKANEQMIPLRIVNKVLQSKLEKAFDSIGSYEIAEEMRQLALREEHKSRWAGSHRLIARQMYDKGVLMPQFRSGDKMMDFCRKE